jgi:predicted N-acyltransferase
MSLTLENVDTILKVAPDDWNALVPPGYPFLRHEFLAGLEEHDCLAPHGWHPCHLLAREDSALAGAICLYAKTNSIGEFVFDWSWAEAYERAGGRYYPKLVNAVPYVPCTGPRILTVPHARESERVVAALVEGALDFARGAGVSSLHWLFPTEEEAQVLSRHEHLTRVGCQYHWHNRGYGSFEDFLETLTSKRRKQIRRERREVEREDVEIETLAGEQITDVHWDAFYEFYCSTFHRRWGEPRFTRRFFRALGRTMPRDNVLVLARHCGEYVAGAFAMIGGETLYGRHWGCNRHFRFLHFELCYYRTIDYCIRRGLRRLDAGAQGEHKLSRGFVPQRTWSAHWLRDPGFTRAVASFVKREQHMIDRYIKALETHSPYRQAS